MNRKEWKRSYKKFSRNKIKRKKSQLKHGESLTRKPLNYKTRKEAR